MRRPPYSAGRDDHAGRITHLSRCTRRTVVTPDDATTYCLEQVRRDDRDRYVATLLAPAAVREALFALYAFNMEIAKTRETVSEALLGEIRLQWWRETIDGIFDGTPRQHQVVTALDRAIRTHDLPRTPFEALIDARARDLDDTPFADLAALERYAEATTANLHDLALHCLEIPDTITHDAARHVAIAWCLIGLLRSVPYHASQRRLYLPQAQLDAAGVGAEDVFHGRFSDGLGEVIRQVAGRAREHLAAARRLRQSVPKNGRRLLLYAVLAERYADALTRAGFNPFGADLSLGELERPLALIWHAWRNRY